MKSIALKSLTTAVLLVVGGSALALPAGDTSLCQSAMQAGGIAACQQVNSTSPYYPAANVGYMFSFVTDGTKNEPFCMLDDLVPSPSQPSIIQGYTADEINAEAQVVGLGNHTSQMYVQDSQGNYVLFYAGSITITQDPITKQYSLTPSVFANGFNWPADAKPCSPDSSAKVSKFLFR